MTLRKTMLFLVLLVLATIAKADQYAADERQVMERAQSFVKSGQKIYHFCLPCRDSSAEYEIVQSSEVKKALDVLTSEPTEYWALYINDAPVDLAYVYVPVHKGFLFWRKERWQNLALVIGLPASEVNEFLSAEQLYAAKELKKSTGYE